MQLVDFFTRRYLARAHEQTKDPATFILRMFFNMIETFDTEAIDVDFITHRRQLAKYVDPEMSSHLVERRAFSTQTYTPPYTKEKVTYRPKDLFKREPGQPLNASQQVRLAEKIAKDLNMLRERLTRLKEYQATEALFTGQSVIVGDGYSDTVDFQMPAAHKVTLTSPNLWSEAGVNILADIRGWISMLKQASGLVPNMMVVGPDVAQVLIDSASGEFTNTSLKGHMDQRRLATGQLGFDPVDLNVTYIGTLLKTIDVVLYEEWWDNGTAEQDLIPANKLMMGSTNARCEQQFGAIEDEEANGGLLEAQEFSKSWTEGHDPVRRYVGLQSRPLMNPIESNAFMKRSGHVNPLGRSIWPAHHPNPKGEIANGSSKGRKTRGSAGRSV